MNSISLSYAQQVHHYFHSYFANWLPDNPINLGDIGTLDKGVLFERKSSLASDLLKIPFTIRPLQVALPVTGNSANHYHFKTNNTVSWKLIPKGDLGLVDGGIEIKFSGDNSFFFNLAGVVAQEIEDQLALEKQILDLYRQDKWKKDWYIVTAILYSSSTTILGSLEGNQSVLLEAKTNAPLDKFENANLQFDLVNKGSLAFEMVSNPNAIPLFKLSRLKSKLFGSNHLGLTEDDFDLDDLKRRAIQVGLDFSECFTLEMISQKLVLTRPCWREPSITTVRTLHPKIV